MGKPTTSNFTSFLHLKLFKELLSHTSLEMSLVILLSKSWKETKARQLFETGYEDEDQIQKS